MQTPEGAFVGVRDYYLCMSAILVQVSISSGGMPKLPVPEARVHRDGVGDDWQLNRKYHGGCERAVCVYSLELYAWLRDEFSIDLQPGSIGENFTTEGIDLQSVGPGDRLRVGDCLIEITKVRVPCTNLNQWDPRLLEVIAGHSGWMARVIQPAIVRPGDPIELIPVGSMQIAPD